MDETPAAAQYEVIFESRIVTGRNPAEVEAAFAERFGEAVAKRVFAGGSVVLKRNLEHDAALALQRRLHNLGLTTRLSVTAPSQVELSIVEEQEQREPKATAAHARHDLTRAAVHGHRPPDPGQQRGEDELKPRAPYATAAIDASFSGEPGKIAGVAGGYGLYLAIVAILMVSLPVLYLLIVLASAYGTYWHAANNIDLFTEVRLSYFAFLLYLSPTIGGVLLTLFLLKPFVAASPRLPQPVRLDAKREPAVFHLVRRITEAQGAPMPTEIQVDADVNASASLRKGVFSRELTLTIGMPLFYGMSIEQLAGVLAHEFGHFVQRFGMRLAAIVHGINFWFYRQAYQRDGWDELIESWSEADNAFVNLSALVAQLGAWLCRLLLIALAHVATALSHSLSRQMEFDADRYEVELTGSQGYRVVAEKMRILSAGHAAASNMAERGLSEGRLPDNIPMLTKAAAESFDAKTRDAIVAEIQEVNRSVFDTHPPDRERIAAAHRLDKPGVFRNPESAHKLLREPHRLGMHVTLQWYRWHNLNVGPEHLMRSEDFAQNVSAKMTV